jgi:lycopene beta-cyclase
MAEPMSCDVAIAGGGLAGGLIALALQEKRPELDIRLVEGGQSFGGNHVWSFFDSDVAREHRWLLTPLVSYAWPAYDVRFPHHERTLKTPYYSIESNRFDAVLKQRLRPETQMLGRRVFAISPTTLVLGEGQRIEARAVIDARGAGNLSLLQLGWQKFVGCELELAEPHGLERPIVMDATVEQLDGYRFVYSLPFGPKTVFVEDTYYSDTPHVDRATLRERVASYAHAQGWDVVGTPRHESGSLPVVIGGSFERYWRSGGAGVAKAGLRAGLFHPTTGYSLPDAVRLAHAIAEAPEMSAAALHDLTCRHARAHWQERGFYRMLDAMLFRAAEPAERYKVLERFYRLRPSLIGRFYAGRATMMDKARILAGKPPVPVSRAVTAIIPRTRRA